MPCKNKECALYGLSEVPFSGNRDADVMFVGESPGREEEIRRKPFVGPSGEYLWSRISRAGISPSSIFVANSARCRIDKSTMGDKQIRQVLENCRPYLIRAINVVKPKIIVAVGGIALQQLIKKKAISKNRGTWFWSKEFDCWVFPVFHPAYIFRNMSADRFFIEDMAELKRAIDNKGEPQKNNIDVLYKEIQSLSEIPDEYSYKNGVVAIDTETQGLDWAGENFVTISASITSVPNTGFNIVFFRECPIDEADFTIEVNRKKEGKRGFTPTEIGVKRAANFDEKVRQTRALICSKKIKKYMFNGNYDLHALDWLFDFAGYPKVKCNNYAMDVQEAAHLLDENIFCMASLDQVQKSFTDIVGDYNKEFASKFDKSDMLSVPLEELAKYACADTDVTLQAGLKVKKELIIPPNRNIAKYLVKFAMPTLETLFQMERIGANIDLAALPKATEEIAGMLEEAKKKAISLVPKKVKASEENISLTRSVVIRNILFGEDGFRIKPVNFTATGEPSTDKNTRKTLLEKRIPKKAKQFIEAYDEWSYLNTMLTRYLRGFGKAVKKDGRIHCKYSLGTTTGRVASSEPNMMNIPKRSTTATIIRRLITASPGYVLLAADESQSELRWAAEISGDENMRNVFRRGEDIHLVTGRGLTESRGIDWKSITDEQKKLARFHAKAVNFGLLYGMSVNGFIKYAKLEYGIDLTEEEAKIWVNSFFRSYPNLKKYHKSIVDFCIKFGYVESPIGKRRRLPEIYSNDRMIRARAERQAINHPIQSVSSDTVLLAANKLREMVNPEEFRLILFIHDELVVEVKDNSKVEDNARLLQHAMVNPPFDAFGYKMSIPLSSDVQIGYNLAEMEELKL